MSSADKWIQCRALLWQHYAQPGLRWLWGPPLFVIALLLLVLRLQWQIWLAPDHGYRQHQHLLQTYQQQMQRNQRLAEKNQQLMDEILLIRHNTDRMEEQIRMELGMIKRNETFVRLLPADGG